MSENTAASPQKGGSKKTLLILAGVAVVALGGYFVLGGGGGFRGTDESMQLRVGEWQQIGGTDTPGGRVRGAGAYSAYRRDVILHGGSDGSPNSTMNDVWTYKVPDQSWEQLRVFEEGPGPRKNHGLIVDKHGDVYVFGGETNVGQALNDLWRLTSKERRWEPVDAQGTLPSPRANFSYAYLEQYESILVYGGRSSVVPSGEMNLYHIPTNTWKTVGVQNTPGPRFSAAMTVDGATGKVFLFGGRNESTFFGDLWAFDLQTGQWMAVNASGISPTKRSDAGLIANPERKTLLLFLGRDQNDQVTPDMFEYDSVTNEWTPVVSSNDVPDVGYGFVATYLPMDHQLFISGGASAGHRPVDATYVLDLKVSKQKPSGFQRLLKYFGGSGPSRATDAN